jgi:hypothetical protein
MDKDNDVEEIPDTEITERQQHLRGGLWAQPILKSQGKSFSQILTSTL